jgi:hypothetical protein
VARRSAWGAPPAAPAPAGDRRRRRGLWLLRGGLALVIAVFVLQVALNPWIFHIGDRFTPLTAWDGYGTVQASNGGHYLLFTHLQAGLFHAGCSFSGCQMVHGSAQICTERGSTYTLQLQGTVQARWSTDGARTSLELRNAKSGPLPAGRVIALAGSWHGERLMVADTGGSFTNVFTPRGVIRKTPATTNNEHASVTLHYGSAAAFAHACGALAARRSASG